MDLQTALISGILAAFTPCVIVLIPALLYRFSHTKNRKTAQILQFVAGFLATFIIPGLLLETILSSSIQYGFQLGIGLLFVTFGVLALKNRFNPLQFPLIKQPLLYGVVFAIIISINPCTFAYLSIITTISTSQLIITILFFGIGMLLPALTFSLFGMSLLSKASRATSIMHRINTVMNVLLISIGGYLVVTIQSFGV